MCYSALTSEEGLVVNAISLEKKERFVAVASRKRFLRKPSLQLLDDVNFRERFRCNCYSA